MCEIIITIILIYRGLGSVGPIQQKLSCLRLIKIPNLKLVIMWDYQNIKTFLLKVRFEIGPKKFLFFKKVENTVPWTHSIENLNGEEIIRTFYEKGLQKTNQKEFRIEKVSKKGNIINCMSNGKVIIALLTVGLIKDIIEFL